MLINEEHKYLAFHFPGGVWICQTQYVPRRQVESFPKSCSGVTNLGWFSTGLRRSQTSITRSLIHCMRFKFTERISSSKYQFKSSMFTKLNTTSILGNLGGSNKALVDLPMQEIGSYG